MIGKLKGLVDEVGEDWALIDVGGVGYMIFASSRTLGSLPPSGQATTLFIETYVREDVIRLYGFKDAFEKAWFLHVQSVQGVGARVALAILDALRPSDMQQAIVMQDKTAFARANGVGPKLAARIISELKDKTAPVPAFPELSSKGAFTPPSSDAVSAEESREGLSDMMLRNDAISALVNLGYNEVRATQAVMKAYTGFNDDPAVDVLIKTALKEIA
jgi:Holliday junction DNA helicase RuvA